MATKYKNKKKLNKKRIIKKTPLQVSVHLRYLYKDKGIRGKEHLRACTIFPRNIIYWNTVKTLY